MAFVCPKCGRPIANRRLAKCSYCGNEIPEILRFTPEQLAELKQMRAKEGKEFEESMKRIPDISTNTG
jgi:hypothetical protein